MERSTFVVLLCVLAVTERLVFEDPEISNGFLLGGDFFQKD